MHLRIFQKKTLLDIHLDYIDAFVKEFTAEHGELAYVVLSMKDYENLAINIADLRRYLEQQNEIIVYYEDALKPEEENKLSNN